MDKIENEEQYRSAHARIEELLPLTWGDDVKEGDPACVELGILTDLAADGEDEHVIFPIEIGV